MSVIIKIFKYWWPTMLVTAIVLWLTLAPHPVPKSNIQLFEGADKVVHATMMFAITLAAMFDYNRSTPHAKSRLRWRSAFVIALCVFLFSVADEWAQTAMHLGRTGDVLDLLADCAGIAAALLGGTPLLRRLGAIIIIFGIGVSSCGREQKETQASNAVYYWRTTFRLSDTEKEFVNKHAIGTIYTRFFDVVEDKGNLRPESSLIFIDKFPEGVRIVPTVFIDSRALNSVNAEKGLPAKILARVDSMMTKNGYSPSEEIQVDFDWTASNSKKYFAILSELRDSLNSHNRKLSVTIRLHQLSMKAPPADYGVLMAYNMGNFKDPDETNSIISTDILQKYIGRLDSYPLKLRVALPLYSWALLFRGNQFVSIAREIDPADTTRFRRIDSIHFKARQYMPLPTGSTGSSPEGRIYPGDIIRIENSPAISLQKALRMMKSRRKDITESIILYHLDDKTISNYEDQEISEIYNFN